ncbi:MAG TPA: four helix bundle protein [Phycisphaerales bacterium]|nr:four helix bundle protein [Phycisphaerales bacterium]
MSQIRSYKDLIVWQKGKNLAKRIYKATEKMPRSEMFGLTSQMRRAAVSIPSNIAEGYNRKTRQEYIRGLRIASGSQAELATQWEIAVELEFMRADPTIAGLMEEIDKMLFALIRKLEQK